MCGALAFEVLSVGSDNALAHYGVADYESWLVLFCLGGADGFGNLLGVVAVDFDYVPVPCAVFGGIVFGVDVIYHGR